MFVMLHRLSCVMYFLPHIWKNNGFLKCVLLHTTRTYVVRACQSATGCRLREEGIRTLKGGDWKACKTIK